MPSPERRCLRPCTSAPTVLGQPVTLPWNTIESSLAPLTDSEPRLAEPDSTVGIEPIIILGAGLAGCWLARLLAERGIVVRLIDAHATVATGASGNPAGIVKPYVTRLPCLAMDFHIEAHRCLVELLESRPELCQGSNGDTLFNVIGVLQLVEQAYPASTHYDSLDCTDAQAIAGIPLNGTALHFQDSGWLNPRALCRELVRHPCIVVSTNCRVSGIALSHEPVRQPHWHLAIEHGVDLKASRLVLACGNALNEFPQTRSLPLVAARGQISRFPVKNHSAVLRCVINGRHYVIPDGESVLVGATFDRDIVDDRIHRQDHARNLAGLRETVPSLQVHETASAGYAGVRATTPDRLPLVGPAPDMKRLNTAYADLRHGRATHQYPALPCHEGLFLLGGLGSRGIVTAPLAATILADMLTGVNTASWHRWAPLLNPARFQIRDLKRGKTR